MQLSRASIKNISSKPGLIKPDERLFSLPEKILQFGTGVLLRGLPDYFVDKANRAGVFNGRIVVVKSTTQGTTDAFQKQDNLYSLCIRGVERGEQVNETIIHSCISRVLNASKDWSAVLACAANPDMEVIISNTTEVGISLTQDDIHASPPESFPGKLLAFLFERYQVFDGSTDKGMVIVPTELIPDNGTTLRNIMLELARLNGLDNEFIGWLGNANHFCNSLVDRIVPGKMPAIDKAETESRIGYQDDLLIMAEPFRLWAIESASDRVNEKLSFASIDEGLVIAPSIDKFRELKLRLLNGTHSFGCGLAALSGFLTVKDAMADKTFAAYIKGLMLNEIGPAICEGDITHEDVVTFSSKVADRFRNPSLEHQWISISVQYSLKMKMRNVPLLIKHYKHSGEVPAKMALGFAAFILFMNCVEKGNGRYEGNFREITYVVDDGNAAWFAEVWKNSNPDIIVKKILTNTTFWGADLNALPGFTEAVQAKLISIMSEGVIETIKCSEKNKVEA